MKKGLGIILTAIMVISMASCAASTTQETQETKTPSAAPKVTPTLEAVATPTPEPEPFVPQDIFGSELNPYGDTDFPDYLTINAASFSQGSAKLGRKALYTLSLTAQGNTDDAIAFLASLAGLTEDEKIIRTDEYNGGGFCEFKGKDGVTFIIRKTNPDDDRYEYVDGCLVEIQYNVDDADIEKYTSLVRDNFNVSALAAAAEYFDTKPMFEECYMAVNLHKKEVSVDIHYAVQNIAAVQTSMAENVKSDWYDEQNGKMGLSYGIINIEYSFDTKGRKIYVSERSSEMKSALSAYVEPKNSLSKLGFGFDQEGICGVYEQRDPHYMSVAIHRPEWGDFADGWNIEFMDEVNGHGLRITYNAVEDKYHISIDKNKAGAAFDYLPAAKEYTGQYPDEDAVKIMFNDAFGTQNEDFYEKPMTYFEQLVQERFNLSIEELYSLPIK